VVKDIFGDAELFSSTFGEASIMSREQVAEWVNIHFPGANIDLVSFLIDGIHNGAYNTIEKTLTFTENEINENILKEEFGHIVFDHLTPEEKEKILNEVKELYPTIEDPIELEERLMEFVRKAEMAKPKSWIGKF